MKKLLLSLAIALYPLSSYAQGPGLKSPPNPWIWNYPNIYFDLGGIALPHTAIGGYKGIGTINVSNGYYVNNVLVDTISASNTLSNKTIASPLFTGTATGSHNLPLTLLPQIAALSILGNGTNGSGNVTAAWTVSNSTDTIIPLVHGSIVANDAACFQDTAGTLKDCGSALGNVTGPSSSVSAHIATFNGTTGKLIQDSGIGPATTGWTTQSSRSNNTTPATTAYADAASHFGSWSSASANTVYQASTDLIVTAYATQTGTSQGASIACETDSSSTPSTIRSSSGSGPSTSNTITCVMPVRKGDYWEVAATGSAGTPLSVTYLSMGN